jgi:dihydroorotate dehydrogenase
MIYPALRRALFFLEAETAHTFTSRAFEAAVSPWPAFIRRLGVADRPVVLKGIRFPNRLGLAAGFDKEGRFLRGAQALGFGFSEVGAVTPKGQPGHPRPRMWRYPESKALRNRMGFNNPGAWALAKRLAQRPNAFPVGVNLGKNATTPLQEALRDYTACFETLFGLADFFVVNVSSPNTEGLRDLQESLTTLLEPLAKRGQELSERFELPSRPLLVKLSPDVDMENIDGLAETALEAGVDGFVASNTTSRREGAYRGIPSEGGLSGPMLHETAVKMVERLRAVSGKEALIVGCGGVRSPETYGNFLQAGADLVQLYTGLVYEGPGIVRRILKSESRGANRG